MGWYEDYLRVGGDPNAQIGSENAFSTGGQPAPQTYIPQVQNEGQFMEGLMGGGDASLLGKVPTWNVNDPNSAASIKAYTSGANAGTDLRGIQAFLRAGPEWVGGQGGDVDQGGHWESTQGADELAKQFGMTIDWSKENPLNSYMDPSKGWVDQNSSLTKLQDLLKNYRLITGLQPGQSGLKTYETLYNTAANGDLTPVWAREWARPENHGWAKSGAGSDFLSAMSLMAPAIGGVIGAGANAAAGGAAGGITGTGGASGAAAYGGAGLGSTLGTAGTASLGSGLAGAAGTGSALASGLAGASGWAGSLANMMGYGNEFASMPGWAQQAANGALQGAGNSALQGKNPLTGAVMGGVMPSVGGALGDLGLGSTLTGGLTGAASGGLSSLLNGGNPLTGAVTGGLGGATSGGLKELGAGGDLASQVGKYASQMTGNYINSSIQDEQRGAQQEVMNGLLQEAQRRGISQAQLQQFLATPQGRAALQAIMAQQGKGNLQSLFG